MDYIKYIPLEMNGIKEYEELNKASNPEFLITKQKMQSVANNHYLSELDENGCKRMESIMNIKDTEGLTVEARRLLIISKANNTLPYTIYNLKTKIKTVLNNDGFEIQMNYQNYILTIYINMVNKDKVETIRCNIADMIPANIELKLIVKYNNYDTFKPFTYNQLKNKGWTFDYMKENYFGGDENGANE